MPKRIALPPDFLKRFGAWERLEPRQRDRDYSGGLEARIADPLWMLVRQWQMGEFVGEDAGSAIHASIRYRTESINYIMKSNSAIGGTDWDVLPLEMLVERESGRITPVNREIQRSGPPLTYDWRMSVRIGQQFERLIAELEHIDVDKTISFYRESCGIPTLTPEQCVDIDYATQRFLRLMAGRAVNGARLLYLYNDGLFPLPPGTQLVQKMHLSQQAEKLKKWFEGILSQPDSLENTAWNASQLEYSFWLSSQKKTKMVADTYRNGAFDWFSVNVNKVRKNTKPPKQQSFVPTRLTFAGMPHARWWALEDQNTQLGNLDIDASQLSSMIFSQFSMAQGNDWLLVPLELPLNSLTWINDNDVTLTNVFGEEVRLKRERDTTGKAHKRWDVFSLSNSSGPDVHSALFVPASVSAFFEESAPIEEVRFLRDEGANMVWAVEHVQPNLLGQPMDGFEAHMERMHRVQDALAAQTDQAFDEEQNEGANKNTLLPQYRLASTVPSNWIPFVPVQKGYRSVHLQRAQMLRNDDDEVPVPFVPGSRLLYTAGTPLDVIQEESIPRAGLRVLLTRQRMRWVDGKTYTWIGRKVLAGKGEGASGLRFDYLKDPQKK